VKDRAADGSSEHCAITPVRNVFRTLFRKHPRPNLYKNFGAVARIAHISQVYSTDSVSRPSNQTQSQNGETPLRRS